nr:uncharacterized protein LOC117222965 [Megalopta genalis]
MYAYILLVAVIGSASAAPTLSSSNVKLDTDPKPLDLVAPPPLLKTEPNPAAAPLLSEASSSASVVAAAPAGGAALGAAPALLGDAPLATNLKAGVPSPKSLSLISELRSPLIAPVITPLLSTRQITPYIYNAPAIAPLELTAAPSSYSIEQHGYRIIY